MVNYQIQWGYVVSSQGLSIGPIGVRKLHVGMATEMNVQYFWDFFSLLFCATYFSPRGGSATILKFYQVNSNKKYMIWGKEKRGEWAESVLWL